MTPTPTTTTNGTMANVIDRTRLRLVEALGLLADIEPAELSEADVLSYVNTIELVIAGAITNLDEVEADRLYAYRKADELAATIEAEHDGLPAEAAAIWASISATLWAGGPR